MIPQIQLTTLVYIIAAVMTLALIIDGTLIGNKLFQQCGFVVGAISLILAVFDRWAWSFRFLHPIFVKRPFITGTWKGVLSSSYKDPETNEQIAPIEAYLVIRQSYSTLHIRLLTKQSTSESLANLIQRETDGIYSVASLYRNTPEQNHRDHSPIHYGSMLLRVEGDPVKSLRAEYWTDRLTRGTIQFSQRSSVLFFDFDSASKASFQSRS